MTVAEANYPRYPGGAPFADSPLHRKLFFGRNADAKNLTDTVLAESLVVVYAKSGTGKTSLINVGLKERLRQEGYAPLVVRIDKRDLGPLRTIYDGIRQAAVSQGFEHNAGSEASLWHYFKTNELWRGDVLLKPVLIIDQFEELFTLHGRVATDALARALAHLLRGPAPPIDPTHQSRELDALSEANPAVKVVLSMREDFLANLDDLAVTLPNILTTRYRLGPLGREQALEAIVTPATVTDPLLGTPPFAYGAGVVDKVLDFLTTGVSANPGEGRGIEAFQVQIVCQHVEDIVRRRAAASDQRGPGSPHGIEIGFEDLGGEDGLRRTILEYYERQLADLPHAVRRRVERLCEHGLASREGRRLSQEEAEITRRFKVDADVLARLVDRRLLRSEPRLGGHHYELSHDTLLFPVLRARDRHARRRRMQVGAALALALILPAALYGSFWHFQSRTSAFLGRFATETDSDSKLIFALAAVRVGASWRSPDLPKAIESLALMEQRETTTVTPLPPDVSLAALSPTAQSLVTATKAGRIELRDPGGRLLQVVEPGPWGDVSALVFASDGTRVAAASGGEIREWDVSAKKLVADLHVPSSADGKSAVITALAFDPTSDSLAVATSEGGWLRVSSSASAQVAGAGADQSVSPTLRRLLFSPDGSAVVGSAADGSAYAWTGSGDLRGPLQGPASQRWASTPDGLWFGEISGGVVQLIGPGGQAWEVDPNAPPTSLAFSPDGKSLAVGLNDGDATVYSLTSADPPRLRIALSTHNTDGVAGIAWSPEGDAIATVSNDPKANASAFVYYSIPTSPQGVEDQGFVPDLPFRRPFVTARRGPAVQSEEQDFPSRSPIDTIILLKKTEGLFKAADGALTRFTFSGRLQLTPVRGPFTALTRFQNSSQAGTRFLVQTVDPSSRTPVLESVTSDGTIGQTHWHWPNAADGLGEHLEAAQAGDRMLFASSEDGRPRLWSASAGGGDLKEASITSVWSYPRLVRVFAQGNRFLLVDAGGGVHLLSLDGTLSSFSRKEGRPTFTFDDKGNLLMAAGTKRPVRWSTASGTSLVPGYLDVHWKGPDRLITVLVPVQASSMYVAVDDRGDVHLMDRSSGGLKDRRVWAASLRDVEDVAVGTSPNEALALTRDASQKYTVVHLEGPPARSGFAGENIAVGADGRFVVTLEKHDTQNPSVRWFGAGLGNLLAEDDRLGGRCRPSALAASPVEDLIVIGCNEGMLEKRTGAGAALPSPVGAFGDAAKDCAGSDQPADANQPPAPRAVRALAFSPSGRFFVGAATGRLLAVWSGDGARLLIPAQDAASDGQGAHPDTDEDIEAIAISRDDVIAAAMSSGRINLWKLTTASATATLTTLPALAAPGDLRETPTALQFSPDGRRLLIGLTGGTLRLLDRSTDQTHELEDVTMRSHGNIVNVAFFGDGRHFAAGSSVGDVQVWSERGDTVIPAASVDDSDSPVAVAVAADGQHVLTSRGLPLEDSPSILLTDWIAQACDRLRFSSPPPAAKDATGRLDDLKTARRYAVAACPSDSADAPAAKRPALLLAAAKAGRTPVVAALLAAGADPNAADAEGRTPLMLALGGGHLDAAAALIVNGANTGKVDDGGQTALHYAAQGGLSGIFSRRVTAGIAVDQPDQNGRTALMIAADRGFTAAMKQLLGDGAAVDAADEFGRTALMYAAEADHADAVDLLLQSKADPNRRSRLGFSFGATALEIASRVHGADAASVSRLLRASPSPLVSESTDRVFLRFPAGYIGRTDLQQGAARRLAAWMAGQGSKEEAAALRQELDDRATGGDARDVLIAGLAKAVGLAGAPDWNSARASFEGASKRGDLLGEALSGLLEASGLGSKQDMKSGINRLKHARDGGEPFAAWCLTSFALDGIGGDAAGPPSIQDQEAGAFGPAWNVAALLLAGYNEFSEVSLMSKCALKVQGDVEKAVRLGDPVAVKNDALRKWLTGDTTLSLEAAVTQEVGLSREAVLLSNAAERPEGQLAFELGLAHVYGLGATRDLSEALKWFKQASEWGDEQASRELARMYEFGVGVAPSAAMAKAFYRRAAAEGDFYSRIRLETMAYGF